MSKPKHTPGPWSVGRYPDDGSLAVVNEKLTIALMDQSFYGNQISKEKCEANAQLIAAAPDMLEALQDAVNWAEAGKPMDLLAINSFKELIAEANSE